MRKFIPDLTGLKLNQVTVIREVYNEKTKRKQCEIKCDCGAIKLVTKKDLYVGKIVSCGCKRKSQLKTHGHTSDGEYSAEYFTWRSMKNRCKNKDNPNYNHYGGRGISYQDSWEHFENFLSDMGKRTDGLTLDRIDNNGNYTKQNCRWVSQSINNANRRNTRELPIGVFKNKSKKLRYSVRFYKDKKTLNFGSYKTLSEAIEIAKKKHKEIWGF